MTSPIGPQALIGHIRELLGEGQFPQAVAACREAVQAYPDNPDLYLQYGVALRGTGQMEPAAECFSHALKLRPDFIEAGLNLGALFLQTGCREQAITTYERLLEQVPDSVPVLVGLGSSHLQSGNPDAARLRCEQALAVRPRNVAAIVLAARIDERQGDSAAAFERLESLINAGIAHYDVAITHAAICRSLKQPERAIAGLVSMLAGEQSMTPAERAGIHFTLGGLYDAAGRYDEAFASYSEGNRLNHRGFDRQQPEQDVNEMAALYSQARVRSMPVSTNTSQLPIFIVGMHRSGTTLVEQILASHPAVHGAGELPDLLRMLHGLNNVGGSRCRYLECLSLLTKDDLDSLSAGYLENLAARDSSALRVTDKMPGNFLYLGFIQQAFPGARIIHCVRNPLDTCLSTFFQNFGGAQTYMNDLDNLGFVYRCYARMMSHWQDVLQLPLHEVRYEDLVSKPEEMIRELVSFCGLEWDANCLNFNASDRYVNTASYDQVRQPMYQRSVGRWKHYDRHLQPLREALGGLAEGYTTRPEV